MDDQEEELSEIISEAAVYGREGDFGKAIYRFSRALDIVVARAKEYAQKDETAAVDPESGIDPAYMARFCEYLKRDKTASVVSNDMALLFARMGNCSSARIFFEQAIDLTPAGVVYDDPHVGLEMLKKIK